MFKGPTKLHGQAQGNLAQTASGRGIPASFGYEDPTMCAMITTPEAVCDDNWYHCSGATNHLTADVSNLMTKSEFLGPKQVHMGNG